LPGVEVVTTPPDGVLVLEGGLKSALSGAKKGPPFRANAEYITRPPAITRRSTISGRYEFFFIPIYDVQEDVL